jgi:putative DNA primase/helicase
MINARDAHTIRRLLVGHTLNGELKALSGSFKGIGAHLAALPPDGRLAAWGGFLSGRADADDVTKALAAVDPLGPPPEAKSDDQTPRPRIKLTRAAEVVCRPVEWLWSGRIPLGMLTLFAGDPKLGKSYVTLGLAAAVSRGAPLPDAPQVGTVPGSVVLLSAEDDPSRTIVPRLKAAGADLGKIHILESVYLADDTEALPSLRADQDAIEAAVEAAGDCRLVVIDPVSAYLGGIDDHRNNELRGVLSPLKALAERHNIAVVLVTHLNKGTAASAKHRVIGSIAYVGAARANFLFVKDKDDPNGRRVFMLSAGCNLTADPPTLAYRIEDSEDGPVIAWESDPIPITAEAALAAESADTEERAERVECDRWLRDMLAHGPVLHAEIVAAGREAGFNLSALNRSKARIGARTNREGFGKGSRCYWILGHNASKHDAGLPTDSA